MKLWVEKYRPTTLDGYVGNEVIKNKIEDIAENHFSSAYDSLTKLGFDKHSELYKFFKIIQERHS